MKDPLFINKIAGAILAALLLIFGLPQLTTALTGGGHHGGAGELHLAYGGDIELAAAADHGDPEPVVTLAQLLADASIASGERRVALCKSCHTFEEGGADGTGPNLWNIVGRQVATVSGFNYTSALKGAGGVWSYDRLDAYLKNSQDFVPGTAMTQRFARDNQRADFLAYLSSLSNSPVPFPELEVIEAVVEDTVDAALDMATDALEEAVENH